LCEQKPLHLHCFRSWLRIIDNQHCCFRHVTYQHLPSSVCRQHGLLAFFCTDQPHSRSATPFEPGVTSSTSSRFSLKTRRCLPPYSLPKTGEQPVTSIVASSAHEATHWKRCTS
jgi:hypothetical protein